MKLLPILAATTIASLVPVIARASDLNVTARSGATSTVTVAPGATVNYQLVGELSDAANDGLAYFRCDLEFDGGPLVQASAPAAAPMTNFARPLGLTNPAGFGGTVGGGKLIQVGGAQNTINNVFAAAPTGVVITAIAKPGTPQVLVTGTLTAPLKVGTFTLKITNLDANVIRQGETGVPFWHCDQAGAGTITNLTVKVSALSSPTTSVSISTAGTQTLNLNAGLPHATRHYWVLGSLGGTVPGLNLAPGVNLPLNPDNYMTYLASFPTNRIVTNGVGTLDPNGQATAVFHLPSGLSPSLVGLTAHHAFLLTPFTFTSEAVSVTLDP